MAVLSKLKSLYIIISLSLILRMATRHYHGGAQWHRRCKLNMQGPHKHPHSNPRGPMHACMRMHIKYATCTGHPITDNKYP